MIYLMLKDARLQSLYFYHYRLSLHILAFYPNAQRPRNRHTVTGHRKATLCVLLLVIGTIDNARVCQRATIFPLRILPHENLRLDTDLRCSQPHTLLSLHHAEHLLNQRLLLVFRRNNHPSEVSERRETKPFPLRQFICEKTFIVPGERHSNTMRVGIPRLHQRFARAFPAARSTHHLSQQLKSPFRRSEIRRIQSSIRVCDQDQGDVGIIVALCNHLCTQEHAGTSSREALQNPCHPPAAGSHI